MHPIEPSADLRLMAVQLRGAYNALVETGFESAEALFLVGKIIESQSKGGAAS